LCFRIYPSPKIGGKDEKTLIIRYGISAISDWPKQRTLTFISQLITTFRFNIYLFNFVRRILTSYVKGGHHFPCIKSKAVILKGKKNIISWQKRKSILWCRTNLAETIITPRVNKMASFISKTYSVHITLRHRMKTKC